jgi:HSP20 family molecular chaperone IbpA
MFSKIKEQIEQKANMSPFSQLNLGGYGGGIDRDFSPILNYIDEFDRHFSRRHRFMTCFIPRFDLEEDSQNYYLYGDIPGATANDITVEAHDNHTLVVYGRVTRPGPQPEPTSEKDEDGQFVKVQVEDHEHASEIPAQTAVMPPTPQESGPLSQTPQFFPPPPPHPTEQSQGHKHHERHHTFSAQNNENSHLPTQMHGDHRILLSERLTGDFHRTFAFPQAVVEEGVRASAENGVLTLVVPKIQGEEVKKGRKIEVRKGNYRKEGE